MIVRVIEIRNNGYYIANGVIVGMFAGYNNMMTEWSASAAIPAISVTASAANVLVLVRPSTSYYFYILSTSTVVVIDLPKL